MSEGILLLSHCGFSFMEDLMQAVRQRGLECYILSSMPESRHSDRLSVLEEQAEWMHAATKHHLTLANVTFALDTLEREGKQVRGCISVWEGYRELSAYANQCLGVNDLHPQKISLLCDKLALRRALLQHCLSEVDVYQLTPERLGELQKRIETGERYFIKPRHGIASYGTFPLRIDTTWETLERITAQAQDDTVYRDIIGAEIDFIAERYIDGIECSFEMVAHHGKRIVAAVHEKISVTSSGETMLEDGCVSPPRNLEAGALIAGYAWLEEVASMLALDEGCFHIEARCQGQKWELIEINPRIGGSLIAQSVAVQTGGIGLLDMWLACLLDATEGEFERWGEQRRRTAIGTLFRVFFAPTGKIARIRTSSTSPAPLIEHILLHEGDVVAQSSREVFLGQCLWTFDLNGESAEYERLFLATQDALSVETQMPNSGLATFLIVDYNLSRQDDVRHLARIAQDRYGLCVALVRAHPQASDYELATHVIDAHPRSPHFVEEVLKQLRSLDIVVKGGIVFSDDAVQSGAHVLHRLGVRVDDPDMADAALSKLLYRRRERAYADAFTAQGLFVPGSRRVSSLDEIAACLVDCPQGIVVKPACEGNNRGVIVIRNAQDIVLAGPLIAPYLGDGIICEEYIPYEREFSFDGVASLCFVTEKLNAKNRYPVEYGQVVPALLNEEEERTLERIGTIGNMLVGQRNGPFHNELRLSDDGSRAAVVEPNRRPGGMSIWHLAKAVYGIDFFEEWVAQALGAPTCTSLPPARGRAMCMMLGAPNDGVLSFANRPNLQQVVHDVFDPAIRGMSGDVIWLDIRWIGPPSDRTVRAIPRDNGDFLASVSVYLHDSHIDLAQFAQYVRDSWNACLASYLTRAELEVCV
jgi:predicted ATP-grasp superfamily ATP-dependent carboligase